MSGSQRTHRKADLLIPPVSTGPAPEPAFFRFLFRFSPSAVPAASVPSVVVVIGKSESAAVGGLSMPLRADSGSASDEDGQTGESEGALCFARRETETAFGALVRHPTEPVEASSDEQVSWTCPSLLVGRCRPVWRRQSGLNDRRRRREAFGGLYARRIATRGPSGFEVALLASPSSRSIDLIMLKHPPNMQYTAPPPSSPPCPYPPRLRRGSLPASRPPSSPSSPSFIL